MNDPGHSASNTRQVRRAVGLDAKVAFLRRPDSYPEGTRSVESIETHMSWVFLTDAHAYKLKKPVAYDYLDFRTLAARKRSCEAEVYLNRRLTHDVYLGTTSLTLTADGRLVLGVFGEPIDWLVTMRRLPADRMVDRLIERGELTAEQLRPAILTLSRFYAEAPNLDIEPAAYRWQFDNEIREIQREMSNPAYGLDRDLIDRVCDRQRDFLATRGEILARRAAEHRILEGHGDLRPEHICLESEPQIIDCLEFHRPFRLLDPADELSFLALECERLGAAFAPPMIFDVYRMVTGDTPPEPLLFFYRSFRASLRGKIAIWHLRDETVREPEKWPILATAYLDAAERYAEGFA